MSRAATATASATGSLMRWFSSFSLLDGRKCVLLCLPSRWEGGAEGLLAVGGVSAMDGELA